MKKFLYIIFVLSSIQNVNAFQWPDWIYAPFFDQTDNIRNKKVVDHSIGFIYQTGSIASEPGNNVSTQWNNANSIGIATHATFNFTSRFWAASNGFSSLLFASNNSAALTNTQHNNLSSTFGYNSDMNIVLGYDVIRLKDIDIACYGGFYNMGINNFANNNNARMSIMQSFIGGVLGGDITYYKNDIVTKLFSEMYITYLVGSQIYKDSTIGKETTNYANNVPALGFGVGGSMEIPIGNDFFIKPFVKLQMMFANQINSGYHSLNSVETDNSGGTGLIQFFTSGLGISWR